MILPEVKFLILDQDNGVLTITLNRPKKRNALNQQSVLELIAVFDAIADNLDIRAVVIRGAEGNFCAGGDISGMSASASNPEELQKAMWEGNRAFGRLSSVVNKAPQVVIVLLEGAVLGGGFGMACVSDVAIADHQAKIAMPETGLGIIPAQIATFVVERIGMTQARRLALLGERINGHEALALGMVHYVTESPEAMSACLESVLKKVRRCAPHANGATKKLMQDLGSVPLEQLLDRAADDFISALNSDEGREGTTAFLQKRLPSWAE